MDFRGKVVLITGAGRGIGAAIARAFAKEGGTVAVNYLHNREAAERVVAECLDLGGDAWAIQADVTSEEQVHSMIEQIHLEMGKIDAVVNNAFRPYRFDPEGRKLAWELEWEDFQSQLDGSLRSVHNVCKAVLPGMRKRNYGRIVNVTTDLVARPVVPYHEYTTAKAAIVGFTRNLAADVGPFGITVNAVAPGLVYPTDASRYTKEEVRETIAQQTPLRRIATPEDVTGPVLFLASDWSGFLTGQTLYVDGGLVMG